MPNICLRYSRDMPNVCPRYAQDMPEKYAKKLGRNVLGENVHYFYESWGKMSLGQNVLGQNVIGAKCPLTSKIDQKGGFYQKIKISIQYTIHDPNALSQPLLKKI